MNLSIEENMQIEKQRELAFNDSPDLNIKEACKIGKGILQLPILQKATYIQTFLQSNAKATFFIPASGSGSRMFEFLFQFLNGQNDNSQGKIERFINHFDEFAFSKKVSYNLLNDLREGKLTLNDFIHNLMNNNNLNISTLPKGLIPFHQIGPFILTPFQSQIVQGVEISPMNISFHFTINKKFGEAIHSNQEQIKNLISQAVSTTYSEQKPETDAFVYHSDQSIVLDEDNKPARRPAGHGALIENLSSVSNDIIFIKNIDNIQHYNKAQSTFETFQFLGGMVMEVEKERNQLLENFSKENFHTFNTKYEIIPTEEENNLDDTTIISILNLPIRICGMVRNEGEPGGGPFWVNKDGITRKQIIEKTQLNTKKGQLNLLINSTHFNPVIMAIKNADKNGKAFDLTRLVDSTQYLRVKKNLKGKDVYYVEKPGLWNGSMYNWLTIFVEVPSETFSPVKSILDLLHPIHKEK